MVVCIKIHTVPFCFLSLASLHRLLVVGCWCNLGCSGVEVDVVMYSHPAIAPRPERPLLSPPSPKHREIFLLEVAIY